MDFSLFVGRICKVDVTSGYFHEGKVTSADEEFLTLIDRKGRIVTLAHSTILNVREISNGQA